MNAKNFVIIGGGVIGSAIARELRNRDLGAVTVLEKEDYLAEHASGRNSGVVHSGINQKPDSMKARMCLKGSKQLRTYCKENRVPLEECGTLVVARTPKEEQTLETLLRMGNEVGVPGLRIINQKELEEREPSAVGTKALLSPTGSIVDNKAFVRSIASDAKKLGAEYVMSAKVNSIEAKTVHTSKGEFTADHIINCAGLYADKIAHAMNVGQEYTIIPFRGEYMELRGVEIKSMIYQPPDLRYPFLGVHLTRHMDGKILAGPTAMLSFGRESYKKEIKIKESAQMFATRNFWRLILSGEFRKLVAQNAKMSFSKKSFLKETQALVKSKIELNDITPYRAGIRAQMVDRQGKMVNDILVQFEKESTHVLNAVSPGFTTSLAFAEHVVNEINKQ